MIWGFYCLNPDSGFKGSGIFKLFHIQRLGNKKQKGYLNLVPLDFGTNKACINYIPMNRYRETTEQLRD